MIPFRRCLCLCICLAVTLEVDSFVISHHATTMLLEKKTSVSYTNMDIHEEDLKLIDWKETLVVDPALSKTEGEGTSSDSIVSGSVRSDTKRTKWGIDNEHEDEYWFNSRIHSLGNNGFLGALHAAMAPFCTKMIDIHAYDNIDIRFQVAEELSKHVDKNKARVIDLCCGVGVSTRALIKAFPDAEAVIGVDTSAEMVSMARFLTRHLSVVKPWFESLTHGTKAQFVKSYNAFRNLGSASFTQANAENTNFPAESFNLVTIMYGFHEAPFEGRARMLEEARRLLQPGGVLAVIDISSDYEPSPTMLAGEPYVLEYQKNIHTQLENFKGFVSTHKTVVPGHVCMWFLKRENDSYEPQAVTP